MLRDALNGFVSRTAGDFLDLVVLVAGQDVDRAPERRPSIETTHSHVRCDQSGGGADGHAKEIKLH